MHEYMRVGLLVGIAALLLASLGVTALVWLYNLRRAGRAALDRDIEQARAFAVLMYDKASLYPEGSQPYRVLLARARAGTYVSDKLSAKRLRLL